MNLNFKDLCIHHFLWLDDAWRGGSSQSVSWRVIHNNPPPIIHFFENQRKQALPGCILFRDPPSAQRIRHIIWQNMNFNIGEIQRPHIFARIILLVHGEQLAPSPKPPVTRLKRECIGFPVMVHKAFDAARIPGLLLLLQDELDLIVNQRLTMIGSRSFTGEKNRKRC